jgi:hypothetical protein
LGEVDLSSKRTKRRRAKEKEKEGGGWCTGGTNSDHAENEEEQK